MKKKFILLGADHPHYKMIVNELSSRDDIEFVAFSREGSSFEDDSLLKSGARAYRKYMDALEAENPDVVGIAMYNGIRGKFIYEAVSRNIPVISDKPLCLSLADYERIKHAHNKNNTPLCMMLTCRNNPSYLAMKNAVHDGLIGNILSVDAVRYYALNRATRPEWMFDRAKYGGPAADILIHDYDLARWITGIDWKEIVLDEYRSGNISDEDFSDGAQIFSSDNGRQLTLKMHWNSPKLHWDRFTVFGTKGFLELSFCDKRVAHINENGKIDYLPLPDIKSFVSQFFDALVYKNIDFPVSSEESLLITERLINVNL